jgi:hypothetical protein
MKKDTMDYEIDCKDNGKFYLTLTSRSVNNILKFMYKQLKSKMKAEGFTEDNLQSIDIPQQQHKLLKMFSKKNVNLVKQQLRSDSIIIDEYNVQKASLLKNIEENIWYVQIVFTGEYIKK